MKIVTVIGARPQFIKAAVMSRSMRKVDSINEVIVHTGQHFDENMSKVFFDELDIPEPDYNLGVGGGTHGQNTGRMLEAIEEVLFKEKPDYLLVYGDTDSTLAGALSATKLHIPVVHVEAGLRSFNRAMPEEINRILTDHVSDLLFAPTDRAVKNLSNEGIIGEKVINVGDVMCDAALYYGAKAEKQSQILKDLNVTSKRFALATIHRQENVDDKGRLKNILKTLSESPLPVLLPLHPRTQKQMKHFGLQASGALQLIDPVGYLDMVMLEKHAAWIATDSGGVQKEAYFHQVPCITFRDETEWSELIELGVNHLLGANKNKIASCLGMKVEREKFETHCYGTGNSVSQIIDVLLSK